MIAIIIIFLFEVGSFIATILKKRKLKKQAEQDKQSTTETLKTEDIGDDGRTNIEINN